MHCAAAFTIFAAGCILATLLPGGQYSRCVARDVRNSRNMPKPSDLF